MKLIQTLPLATMSVCLYVAVFHLYMFLKKNGNRTHLSFTCVCLYESLLAFISLMNYSAESFEDNLFWMKLFFTTFPAFPAAFIHFAYDFTNQDSRKIPWRLTVVCAVAMLIMGISCLLSSQEKPIYIPVDFLNFSYVTYRGSLFAESIKILVVFSAYPVIVYGHMVIFKYCRAGNKAARPIFIGSFLFFLCGINDTLIEARVYSFLFLAEYGGLFLVLGMAQSLISRMAAHHEETSRTEAFSAVGKMASEVVHDLTTPLDAIKLAASIARKDRAPDTQEKYLSLIEKETKRLSDLSFDILTFVNNKGALSKKTVDLKPYMDEVFFPLKEDFKQRRIGCRYILDYDGQVVLDPDAFKRIIINLASNARDCFSADGGQAPKPEFIVRVSKRYKHIIFTFRDNGPGIPDDIKKHIFEMFSSYGSKSGTGLGLVISKQIVDRHGGSISCESLLNEGTTFRVTLPA